MTSLGDTLRKAREAKGASLSEAAEATRIKSAILAALEVNDYSRIAAPLYARGFLKLYAEFLAIDPAPLIREYNTSLSGRRIVVSVVEPEQAPVPKFKAPAAAATPRESAAPAIPSPAAAIRPAAIRPAPAVPAASMSKVPAPNPAARTEFRLEAEAAPRETSPAPQERKPQLATPVPPRAAPRTTRAIPPPRRPASLPGGLRYLPIGIGLALVIVLIVSALNRCAKQTHRAPVAATTIAPAPVISPSVRPAGNNNRLQLAEDPPLPYLKMKP